MAKRTDFVVVRSWQRLFLLGYTVSWLFSAWETRGLVKPRRKAVTICEVQALSAIAEETWEDPAPIDGRAARHAPF